MLVSLMNAINLLASFTNRYGYPETGFSSENERSLKDPPFVQTELGGYEGYFMRVLGGREIYAFEGIHFAEKPERFMAPQRKKPFYGNFSAKEISSDCIQLYQGNVVNPKGYISGSEDCLTCNIYSPMISKEANLPVLMFFYGGAYLGGSSNDYGPAYLLEKDIVLVNCNYRLSVHGFLSTGDEVASGNWGLKDAAMALDWVHLNIQYFGGSPQKIVLSGQSAGATLVHLLTLSEPVINSGKVAGAICFSGNALVPWAIEDPINARRKTRKLAIMSFCPINQGSLRMVKCLRQKDPRRLTILSNLLQLSERSSFQFRPVIEPKVTGAFITNTPSNLYKKGKASRIPIIFSMTSQDVDVILMSVTAIGRALFPLLPNKSLPNTLLKYSLQLAPTILQFKGLVQGREQEVSKKIIDFYGGASHLEKNPRQVFKILQDRMFTNGLFKSLQFHSRIGPTHGLIFGYNSNRGYTQRMNLDPKMYGAAHGEDIILIFNRTDIQPTSKKDADYKIVKIYQNILLNFGNYGKFQYSTEENEIVDYIEPIDPEKMMFDMFLIEKYGAEVVQMELTSNVSMFWDSLGINEFPNF